MNIAQTEEDLKGIEEMGVSEAIAAYRHVAASELMKKTQLSQNYAHNLPKITKAMHTTK